jgi:acyl-CoA synthetase (AMP-forming)/AMP-acid ligase II
MLGDEPATLVELLRRRASGPEAGKVAFRFLSSELDVVDDTTFHQLDLDAGRLAAGLADGFAPGGRVLISFPPSLDFVRAFLGCLYAALIPVPVYPPRPTRLDEDAARLRRVAADCGAEVVLGASKQLRALERIAAGPPELAVVTPDDCPPAPWNGDREVGVRSDSLALIQYTSGSTGEPRGVALTHANLLANQRAIRDAFDVRPDEVALSWLPLYHDMGLIGAGEGLVHLDQVHVVQ